ncbi:MAG: hypothetical protein E6Q97_09915 [Desulfurellales bacterium]|nr:MAG: hypothetical protein E6Q97_09915 [Desulfurellales bacterium]
MTNIVKFPGKVYQDLPADEMLAAIAEQKPLKVFVIVWPEDGTRPTYHSNTSDIPVIVLRIQQFLHKLFSGVFTEEEI